MLTCRLSALKSLSSRFLVRSFYYVILLSTVTLCKIPLFCRISQTFWPDFSVLTFKNDKMASKLNAISWFLPLTSDGLSWSRLASDGLWWPRMASNDFKWPRKWPLTAMGRGQMKSFNFLDQTIFKLSLKMRFWSIVQIMSQFSVVLSHCYTLGYVWNSVSSSFFSRLF